MSMTNELKNLQKQDDTNFFVRLAKYFFPCKGDSVSEIVRKIIFMLSIVLFLMSLNELTNFLKNDEAELSYTQSITKYEPDWNKINSQDPEGEDAPVVTDNNGTAKPTADPDEQLGVRKLQEWAKELREKNEEVVGWIKIPGFCDSFGNEYINFPVLQKKYEGDIDAANDYYLTHDINNNYYESGSIFADCYIPIDENGQPDNIVIYGHNMRRIGTVFSHLNEYKSGVDQLKKYPVIEFNTVYERNQRYVIIGCFVAAVSDWQDDVEIFDYWRFRNFDNDKHSFERWISNVRKQSWYSCDVECTADDDYITLSTCSNEVKGMRYVIVAKKLRPDENLDLIIRSYEEKADRDIYFPKVWRNVWGNNKKYLGWAY